MKTDYIFSSTDRPQFDLDSSLTSLRVDEERENGTLTAIISRNKLTFTKA